MTANIIMRSSRRGVKNFRQNFYIVQNVGGHNLQINASLLLPVATPITAFRDIPLQVNFVRTYRTGQRNSRCLMDYRSAQITCLLENKFVPTQSNVSMTVPIGNFL
jgi:hypothetical protein